MQNSNNAVKQIFYTSREEGNDKYFDDIANIAMFIGSALQHPNPRCNDYYPFVSSISVEQYKEKFGRVIVYVNLASHELMNNEWKFKNSVDPISVEFKKQCVIRDILHYRKVYMNAISLFPHYKDAIIEAADKPELLFDNHDQLEIYLNIRTEMYRNLVIKYYMCDHYNEFKQMLYTLYKQIR